MLSILTLFVRVVSSEFPFKRKLVLFDTTEKRNKNFASLKLLTYFVKKISLIN